MNLDEDNNLDQQQEISPADDAVGDIAQEQVDTGASTEDLAGDKPASQEPAAAKAEKDDVKEGMLDRVKSMMGLKKDKDAPADKAAAAPQDQKKAGAEKKEQPEKSAAEQAAAEIPKEVATHPAYRAAVETARQYQEQAARYERFENYMQANNIPPDDANRALELTALAQRNPEEFFAKLGEIYENFAITLGKKLPPDLQKEVDEGYMGEAQARAAAKDRTDKARAERERDQERTVNQVAARENAQKQSADFVARWFEDVATRDPHLEQKSDAIVGEMMRLQQVSGAPENLREVKMLLDAAYDNVSKRMSVRPKTPTGPVPGASGNRAAAEQAQFSKTNPEAAAAMNLINRMRGF